MSRRRREEPQLPEAAAEAVASLGSAVEGLGTGLADRAAFLAEQEAAGATRGQALYRWRLERGRRRGLSRTAARGHERTPEHPERVHTSRRPERYNSYRARKGLPQIERSSKGLIPLGAVRFRTLAEADGYARNIPPDYVGIYAETSPRTGRVRGYYVVVERGRRNSDRRRDYAARYRERNRERINAAARARRAKRSSAGP